MIKNAFYIILKVRNNLHVPKCLADKENLELLNSPEMFFFVTFNPNKKLKIS